MKSTYKRVINLTLSQLKLDCCKLVVPEGFAAGGGGLIGGTLEAELETLGALGLGTRTDPTATTEAMRQSAKKLVLPSREWIGFWREKKMKHFCWRPHMEDS